MNTVQCTELESTKLKAAHKINKKGKLLSHGAGEYSIGGVSIHIWGHERIGYTCDYETAKKYDLLMCL